PPMDSMSTAHVLLLAGQWVRACFGVAAPDQARFYGVTKKRSPARRLLNNSLSQYYSAMPTLLARTPGTRTPRVIIYARVSKDQQSGRSVSQQLKIGRRVADDNGWTIVGEYSDNDKSASRYASSSREDWTKVE